MGKGLIKKLKEKREKTAGSIEEQPEVKSTFEKVTRQTTIGGYNGEDHSNDQQKETPVNTVDNTIKPPYGVLEVTPQQNDAIEFATNLFATRVTLGEYSATDRAIEIVKSFAPTAVLRATVSAVDRHNKDQSVTTPTIFNYFQDHFSASVIPGLRVSNAKYNVMKLTDDCDHVLMNHAYVEFSSDGALPIIARMTFTFSKNPNSTSVEDLYLIQVLDSSPLFESVPDSLVKQGDVFNHWDVAEPKKTLY